MIVNHGLSADLNLGKELATQVCTACHGLDGQSAAGGNSAITPNLTAQNKEYLIAKLKDYRSGKLKDHIMSLIAQNLQDEDIENLAEWYSSIKIKIEMPK